MSETSGGSSDNATSSGQNVPCKKCSFLNPPNVKFCGECGSSLQGVLCKKCNEANSANAKYCGNCGVSLLERQRKPCLLCNVLLHPTAQNCPFCSAPQDEEVFDQTPLKQCFNSQCAAYLMVDFSVCYRCKSLQPQNQPSKITADSHMATSSVPPAVSREQMLAMYGPHPDQSNKPHHGVSLVSLDVPVQPPMSGPPPPSGVLPTATTPGKAAIVPDNNLDTTPMEVELSPSTDIIPKSSVSSPSSNGKRHCTNEVSDSPDKKSKTEDTGSSSAAMFVNKGGAVVREQIAQPNSSNEGSQNNINSMQGDNTETILPSGSLPESSVAPDSSSKNSDSQHNTGYTFNIEGMNNKTQHKLPPTPSPEITLAPGVSLPPELHIDDQSSNELKGSNPQVIQLTDSSNESKAKPDDANEKGTTFQDSTWPLSKQSINEARKRKKPDGTEDPVVKKSLKEEESPSVLATPPQNPSYDPNTKLTLAQEVVNKGQNETLASQAQITSTSDDSTGNNDSFIGEASYSNVTPVSSPIAANQDDLSKKPQIKTESLSTLDPNVMTDKVVKNGSNLTDDPKAHSTHSGVSANNDNPLENESSALPNKDGHDKQHPLKENQTNEATRGFIGTTPDDHSQQPKTSNDKIDKDKQEQQPTKHIPVL